jgi:hypothetical protein
VERVLTLEGGMAFLGGVGDWGILIYVRNGPGYSGILRKGPVFGELIRTNPELAPGSRQGERHLETKWGAVEVGGKRPYQVAGVKFIFE